MKRKYRDICMDLLAELECLVAAVETAKDREYAAADLQRMERMLKEATVTANNYEFLWSVR